MVTSAEELAKADNKDATELLEKAKKLAEQLEKLVALAEKRSRIALSYVVLNKREQQASASLIHIGVSLLYVVYARVEICMHTEMHTYITYMHMSVIHAYIC